MASVTRKRDAAVSNGSSKKGEWLAPYRFKPGESGNPRGERKNDNLTAHIRKATDGGKTLCEFMVKKFSQELPPEIAATATAKDVLMLDEQKIEAATWLADRGFSKPKPVEDEEGQKTLGNSLLIALVSLGPSVVRDLSMKLIELEGGVIDAQSTEIAPGAPESVETNGRRSE